MATFDVLLPVRNGAAFLAAAIDSIKAQTFADWRLLILDHGSRDGSMELGLRYAESDRRIEVHSIPHAQGLAGLLNHGFRKCDCRYLLRQDSDDISLPHRMTATLEFFADKSELLLAGSQMIVIDAAGQQIGYRLAPSSYDGIAAASFFYNPIAHPTAAMNFAAISRLSATYGEDFLRVLPHSQSIRISGASQDYFLFGQLIVSGLCLNIEAPLIKYRVHDRSVGSSSRAEQTGSALRISRFLAHSFCALKGLSPFDPLPFCTHGEYVFDCGHSEYAQEFSAMAAALHRGISISSHVERELAFRWVFENRKSWPMLFRYLQFSRKHGMRAEESRPVRNWLLRNLRKQYVYKVEDSGRGAKTDGA